MNIECSSCRYAELTVFEPCAHEAEGLVAYECRRYPPQCSVVADVGDGDATGIQTWPTVHANDWCGEFQPSEETAA